MFTKMFIEYLEFGITCESSSAKRNFLPKKYMHLPIQQYYHYHPWSVHGDLTLPVLHQVKDRIREHLKKSCMVLSLSSWYSHETPCLSEKREWDMTTAKLLRCYVDTQVKMKVGIHKVNTSYRIIMVIILNFKSKQ